MAAVWTLFILLAGMAFWRADGEYHRICELIREHAPKLAERKRALIKTDPYGSEDDADWQAELDRFAANTLKMRGHNLGDAIRTEVERAIARLPESAISDNRQ